MNKRPIIAGIDVGGTKIRYILRKGEKIVSSTEIKTPKDKNGFERVVKDLLLDLRERGIKKVGIGVPGRVSGSTLLSARNLRALGRIDFSQLAPRGMSVLVDNDARCFARSETAFGRVKNRCVLALTLGTGVGRALTKNHTVIALSRFEGAEAWESEYQKLVHGSTQQLALFLGKRLSGLILEIKPDVIVVGGGTLRKKSLFSLFKKELRKHGVTYPVYRSHFRQNAAAIGAAALAHAAVRSNKRFPIETPSTRRLIT